MPYDDLRYDSLIELVLDHGVDEELLTDVWKERLRHFAYFSPRLSAICQANPGFLIDLIHLNDLELKLTSTWLLSDWGRQLSSSDHQELLIRNFHRSMVIRIALRDLCDLADSKDITEELSLLAEFVVRSVFDMQWDKLTAQHGLPYDESGEHPAYLTVIAMGKLGGHELNFSSDIDLIFVYDFDGATQKKDGEGISNTVFFAQLSQSVCDVLSKSTEDGFFYRVDMRLRPEGDNGPLAVPMSSIEFYYQSYGQNWERQALLKARPIAGDLEVGKRFLRVVNPFTYRKYVDKVENAEVLRGIDGMRNRSLEQIGPPEKQATNFKNGYGGIRDIEFFVQAVQILYGGQYPEIKLEGTLVSLQRMHESHLLHSREYTIFTNAYRFLRRIEHRLQMVSDLQVYDLPTGEDERQRLADSMGYETYADFLTIYRETTFSVRELYEGVFHRDEWEDTLKVLVDSETFNDKIHQVLTAYDFADTKQAFTFLKALRTSHEPHLQSKTTRLFNVILPRLLICLKKTPDSDLALKNFEKMVSKYKAKTALYETMRDQPAFMGLLVTVTGASSFLTRLVLRDISLMEFIGRDGYLDETISIKSLDHHLHLIMKAKPKEDVRSHILRVQNAAMFRIGIRFILGLADVERLGKNLTNVADHVLSQSMKPIHQKLSERFPEFTEANADRIAVIGLGKLGGREFNVASDCDLVFVYGDVKSGMDSSPEEYFSRWVTQYTKYLFEKTPLGFLYEPDTRLRPHGVSGPLASSQKSFRDYFKSKAQFWEKMALSRARFICGNPEIRDFLEDVQREILYTDPMSCDETNSLLDMRRKIEHEKRKETLKAGPGGLVDVEFIAQALSIHYGPDYEALRSTATFDVLRAAEKHSLLKGDDAETLIESYAFLREVENRLRIVNNVSLDDVPTSHDDLKKMIRRYALRLDMEKPTPEDFLEMISLHTNRIRKIYDRFFDDFLKKLC